MDKGKLLTAILVLLLAVTPLLAIVEDPEPFVVIGGPLHGLVIEDPEPFSTIEDGCDPFIFCVVLDDGSPF